MPNSINRNHFQHYSTLELIAKQVVEGFITGLHKSPFHGFSVEFAEHRLYNAGESTRHIDWKIYGKTDKLFVKRYEEETNLRCQLVIDSSASMYFPFQEKTSLELPNKMSFSVYAAAAIIEILKRQRDTFGLTNISQGIDFHSQARSNEAHKHLLNNQLETLLATHKPKQDSQSNIADNLHQIAEMIHKRSLVIIFSDMFDSQSNTDDIFAALQHLKHNKHEVILFHVVQKSLEIEFEFQNRPYKFIDAESGEMLKLSPKEVKQEYVKQAQAFSQELKLRCGQHKIDFVEADINQGLDAVLLAYLLKRQKML